MGCCASKDYKTVDEWESKMIHLEGEVFKHLGFNEGEVERCYTNIEMDNAPFKVRTYYFNKEDRSKRTLILMHGN
jgi:hypothetical protein